MNKLNMSMKEREQIKVFQLVKEGHATHAEAAARLNITRRWVRKKIKRYYANGDDGVVHKSKGKKTNRGWKQEEKDLLIELLNGPWHGFGPTYAAKKLKAIHSISVSKETVRQAMIKANLWKPKEVRVKHRERRERRPMLGMMIQLDGSPHDWFEGRAEKCTLIVFIDDATSKILWLEFAKSESVAALMQATKNYVQMHGIPQSFYTDHGSVFHVNLNNAEGYKKTQWENAVAQLGIEVIHAHSPQAKGRVERCNQTMQDHLVKDMRLAGISSIDAANHFLRTSNFIELHNNEYSDEAAQKGNAHRNTDLYKLDDIFCIQETRVLANDFTITYNKRILQLDAEQRTLLRPKNEITVKVHLDGALKLWIRKTELFFSEIKIRPKPQTQEKKVSDYKPYKPSENSRRWVSGLLPQSRMKPAEPAVEAF